jgi:hypothetical protein
MAIPTGTSAALGNSGAAKLNTGLGAGGSVAALKYPGEMVSQHTDYVRFDFYKYKPPFASTGGDDLSSYNMSLNMESASDLSSVILYMPEDISSDYGASWGGKSFSNIGAGILKTAGPTMEKGNVAGSVQNLMGAIKEQVEGFGPALAAAGISKAINEIPGAGGGVSVDDILSGTRGVILNPNAELMFDKAEMRTFSLSFKMVPRNAREAETVKGIITTFKKASLPSFGGEGALGFTGAKSTNFIGVPNIIDINFMKGNELNKHVSQYKPCALTTVKINYTPDGTYNTTRDGAPVAISLDLSFAELKVLYRQEINSQGWSY